MYIFNPNNHRWWVASQEAGRKSGSSKEGEIEHNVIKGKGEAKGKLTREREGKDW